MNKRNLILILSIFILSSCSSGESNNSKFNASNKKNYNDIQSALKNDPNNAGTDTNQNPDDYKIERHKGAVANEDEYNKPETKDEITKEELDKKRDEDAKDGIINISDGIFLPLVNDIYINKDEYLGKKVRIVGQNVRFEDKDTGEVVYAILREGPGCCYNDSVIGFEFITEDGKYPEPQKWYEMVGEVVLDNYGTGKVVKLKMTEIKEVEAKSKKIIHFN